MESVSGDGRRGALLTFLLAAFCVVAAIPGLYDFSFNTRLAIYPLTGIGALWAGAGRIPRRLALCSAVLPAVQLLGLFSAQPVNGVIPQIVRWVSFWMMLCGAGGMLGRWGRRPVFDGLAAAAVLMAVLSLLMPDDLPSGNPNRQGPLLAISLTALATGISRPRALLSLPLSVVVAAGLWKSSFYSAIGAFALSTGWFFLARKWKGAHPGAILAVMILAQSAIIIAPGLAARIHPSLELRALMWRSGVDLLGDAGYMGTGTARSRLDLFVSGGDRLQILAGPERRVDFLHSEFLSLPVEQGMIGAFAVLLLFLLIWRTRFSPARGAVLICCLPFAAADLPLATPLGAFPLAIGFAWALSRDRRLVVVPRALILSAAIPALVWMIVVVAGSRAMERGIRLGAAGRAREAAEELALASRLMPWEERSLFFQATAEARASMPEKALETISRFNREYPEYWRAWAMQADLLTATGHGEDAPEAFLEALILAPAGTPSLGLIAFNAAAEIPRDSSYIAILASELILTGSEIPVDDPAILVEYAARAAAAAAVLDDPPGDISSSLVLEALSKLQIAARMQNAPAADIRTALLSIRPVVDGMEGDVLERARMIFDSIESLMMERLLDTGE